MLYVKCFSIRKKADFDSYRKMLIRTKYGDGGLATKLCSTLWDPMDYGPLGSSVHGISQSRILEWVAISFSRVSSWSRDWTCVLCIGRQILYRWATKEAPSLMISGHKSLSLCYLQAFDLSSSSKNSLTFCLRVAGGATVSVLRIKWIGSLGVALMNYHFFMCCTV